MCPHALLSQAQSHIILDIIRGVRGGAYRQQASVLRGTTVKRFVNVNVTKL